MTRRMPLIRSALLAAATATGISLPVNASAQTRPDSAAMSLVEAVERALATHPSVRAGRAVEDAAVAGFGEARSQRWPELSVRAAATRFQEPMIVAPLHAFDIQRVPEFDRTLLGGDLSLRYTLFDGGGRGARIAQSRAEVAAAAADAASTELELIARVVDAYLRVLTATEVEHAVEAQLRALGGERDRVRLQLETGTAARVELLRVEAAVAQAESERVATRAERDLAARNLARLTNTTAPAAGQLERVTLAPDVVSEDRVALVAQAAARNPLLARTRAQIGAARSGARLAVAAWFPRLDVSGGYVGFAGADAASTAEWQLGVRLSYPLFTGGRRASAVSRARAQLARAEEGHRLQELATREGVDRAANGVAEWRARVVAGATAVSHLTEVARIERLALTEGAGTQTDYLRAEAQLADARARYARARHAEIMAWVTLAHVIGDLSPEWLTQQLESTP